MFNFLFVHLFTLLFTIGKTPTQPQLKTLVGLDTKMTLHTPHPTTQRNSMLAISQLLLTRFWWNFKHRFLGTSKTDSNYQVDICPGNICSYQEYLSCYRPDFDEILKVTSWEHLEQIPFTKLTFLQATIVLVTFVHISNISAGTDPILMKLWM